MKYKNIHTGMVCEVVDSELVSNPPIRVFILSDGTRWDKEQFNAHWREVKRDFAQEYEDREKTD